MSVFDFTGLMGLVIEGSFLSPTCFPRDQKQIRGHLLALAEKQSRFRPPGLFGRAGDGCVGVKGLLTQAFNQSCAANQEQNQALRKTS